MRTVISQRLLMNASISVSTRLVVVRLDPDGVTGQERVGLVLVELRSLVRSKRVLHRKLMQAELAGELVQDLLRRGAQIHPDQRVRILQVVRHLGKRKVLTVQHALAPHPGRARSGHITVRTVEETRRDRTRWPSDSSRATRRSRGDHLRCAKQLSSWKSLTGRERASESVSRRDSPDSLEELTRDPLDDRHDDDDARQEQVHAKHHQTRPPSDRSRWRGKTLQCRHRPHRRIIRVRLGVS